MSWLQRPVLCIFFIISVVVSKPVKGGNKSESSESSSEEEEEEEEAEEGPEEGALEHPEPEEDPQGDPTPPTAQELTDPPYGHHQLPDSTTGPALDPHQTAPPARPDLTDVPSSTGTPAPMTPPPESDPSLTPLWEGFIQGSQNTDPVRTDVTHGGAHVIASDTNVCQGTESVAGDTAVAGGAVTQRSAVVTSDVLPSSAATPFVDVTVATPPPYFCTTPQAMPISATMASLPVCFTIHYPLPTDRTTEAVPLRGDA